MSRSSSILRMAASRRGAHALSSSRLSLTSVYWYCAWLTRPPRRTSCIAWRNSVAPGTSASLGRSRAITWSALSLRSARGLSAMNMRPVLLVVPQRPGERPLVESEDPAAPLYLGLGLRAQEYRAHHRGRRERHEERDDDRD